MTYNKNDPSTIQNMFNSIASNYDRANAVLSFKLHKSWNRKLVSQLLVTRESHSLLDLCSGTGDIAMEYMAKTSLPCKAYLLDFSANMLVCAKEKLRGIPFSKHAIHYIEGDAQSLPLQDNTIDRATLAYGIRNIKNPSQCLSEAFRVLKPGGQLGILELTQPTNSLLRFGHHLYLKTFLPLLGKMLTDNQDAYHYLQNSIKSFIAPAELENMMKNCQFVNTKRLSLAGGIATILIGTKP